MKKKYCYNSNYTKRNYQYGKIYMIKPTCEHKEYEVYICSSAKKNLANHMSHYHKCYHEWKNTISKWKYSNIKYVYLFELFEKYGIENFEIVLLENYPCNSNKELLKQTFLHIEKRNCINKIGKCFMHLPVHLNVEFL